MTKGSVALCPLLQWMGGRLAYASWTTGAGCTVERSTRARTRAGRAACGPTLAPAWSVESLPSTAVQDYIPPRSACAARVPLVAAEEVLAAANKSMLQLVAAPKCANLSRCGTGVRARAAAADRWSKWTPPWRTNDYKSARRGRVGASDEKTAVNRTHPLLSALGPLADPFPRASPFSRLPCRPTLWGSAR